MWTNGHLWLTFGFGRKQSYNIWCTFGFGVLQLVNLVVAESVIVTSLGNWHSAVSQREGMTGELERAALVR